jgi:hypothetical protein
MILHPLHNLAAIPMRNKLKHADVQRLDLLGGMRKQIIKPDVIIVTYNHEFEGFATAMAVQK